MQPLAPSDPRTAGEFRLSARLGLGGMGQVFLGYSPAGRAVAVKICHPELAADPAFVERFAREATAAQAVNGLYTAQVVGAGPYDRPPWMATAYVPGPSLTDYVYGYGPLPEPAAWRLAAGLAEALLAVHACGLVHRDLKPSNVLLAVDGPRVIDFGIASALEGPGLTNTGSVMGSPPYMSPEQAMGVPTGPPSDVFALGSTLAFAACGAPPFGDGDAAALLFRVVHLEPALASVPERLRGMVAACLAKDPAARPTLPQLLRACQDGAAAGGNSAASFWPPQMTAVIAGHQAGSMNAAPPNGTVPSNGQGLYGGQGLSGGQVLSGWRGDPHPPTVAAVPGGSTQHSPLVRAATTVATAIGRRRVLSGLGGLVVAGGLAAAGFELAGSGSTAAAVTDKRVAWVHKADGPVRTGAAISADGGTVYIGSDRGTVYAFNAASGRPAGTHRVGGAVTGLTMDGVGAVGDTLLVGCADGKVYAFTTGGQGATWTSQAAGAAIVGTPTAGGKAVYAGSLDGNFYAINLITGQREWQAKTGVAMPSPLWNNTVWAGSQDGTMYVFNAKYGKLLDKISVGDPVSAAPLDVVGQVYVATSKGVMYDLFYEDLLNGAGTTVNWKFQGDGAITGSPVLTGNGDTFFLATVRGTVYAIQPGSDIGDQPGTALWTFHPGGPVRSGLAFRDNVLYVGSDDGYLYAIDTTGPTLSWKHKTGGAIRSQILVTPGFVYFGSLDNHVYALRT